MKHLWYSVGIIFLLTTTGYAQTSQAVKIHILESMELRRRVENTSHVKSLSQRMQNAQSINVRIYWKFRNQRDFIAGKIRLENQLPVQIDSSQSELSMPFESYVEYLKQEGNSTDLQVYTDARRYWFTLYPADYAIQADMNRVVAQLKRSSRNQNLSVEGEIDSLLGRIGQARKQGLSVNELKRITELEKELLQVEREKQRSELERQLLERELDGLKRELDNSRQQSNRANQTSQKDTERIRQLETELGRVKRERARLQYQSETLQGDSNQATQQLKRFHDGLQKLNLSYQGQRTSLPRELANVVKTGRLELEIRPRPATIFIDDQSVGSESPLRIQLPVGWHSVTVSADGYDPQAIMVKIEAGTTLKRTLRLSLE
jgi:chromosome segregation ATPase